MRARGIGFAAAALAVLVCGASGADLSAGYDLHGNVAGLSHSIAAEAGFTYLETGLAMGYGAKAIHERETVPAGIGGPRESLYLRRAGVFRLHAPVRLKYGNWPYLFGQLAYERILDVEGVEETEVQGFAKGNEFTLQYGAGYAHWFGPIGIRLEVGTGTVLTDPDKTAYYRDAGAAPGAAVRFYTGELGSRIIWQAGLRYRFRAPGA